MTRVIAESGAMAAPRQSVAARPAVQTCTSQNSERLHVLVTGATGRQGSAVARALLARGHQVTCLVRGPHLHEAAALLARGAELAIGDLDDSRSLDAALLGANALFAMTPRTMPWDDDGRWLARGCRLIDAARRAGIQHVIYSSNAGDRSGLGAARREDRYAVEEYLRATPLAWTVVRPTFFMDNLLEPAWIRYLRTGVLPLATANDHLVHQTAITDLAQFVAMVFEQRTAFSGCAIDVSSDGVSGPEMAEVLSGKLKRKIAFVPLPPVATIGDEIRPIPAATRWPEVGWHTFAAWAYAQRFPEFGAA